MSVLFDSYEDELRKALNKAKVIMNNFHMATGQQKPNYIKDIREKIREAEKNKAKMESEYAVAPPQMKAQFKKKVETCFKEFEEIRNKFNRLESGFLNENLTQEETKGQNERNNTVNINEQLGSQNQRLRNARRMAHQTQEIVNFSNVELVNQGERMHRIQEINNEVDTVMDRVDKLTRIMRNKDLMNKVILGAVIVLLGITIIIIIILKIKRAFS